MLKHFLPDRQIEHYYDLRPEDLKAKGVRLLIADIDNTLVPYADRVPTADVKRWISDFQAAGVAVALLSNNNRERVELFNSELGVFALHKSGKPKRSAVEKVLDELKIPASEAALLGDQLFTDVLCGRRAGVYTVLTDRINDKESFFIKLKRLLEIPIRKILGIK